MTMTVETARLNNQSILQNFGLVEELGEQAAEIISGGDVTIRNTIGRFVLYKLDGSGNTMSLQPGQQINLPVNNERRIDFDMLAISPSALKYIPAYLSDGQTYEFRPNNDTPRSDDIYLYLVGP